MTRGKNGTDMTRIWRAFHARASYENDAKISGGKFRRIWRAHDARSQFLKFLPIFIMLTNFQNFDSFFKILTHFSKFLPIFKILTHFQNFDPFLKFDPFSKCWTIFKILTQFQHFDPFLNFDPFSKFWPIFKMLTYFQSVRYFKMVQNFENRFNILKNRSTFWKWVKIVKNGSTFWKWVKSLKMCQNFETVSKFWKCVEILKMGQILKIGNARHVRVICASYARHMRLNFPPEIRASFTYDARVKCVSNTRQICPIFSARHLQMTRARHCA